MKTKEKLNLSDQDIAEIKFLARQGIYDANRTRLIKNLYSLNNDQLQEILFNSN